MPENRRKSDDLPGALAIARSIRGWSQARLAKAAGVAPSSLSNYERGHTTPSMRSLQRIASALGVSVVEIFELASVVRRFRPGEGTIGRPAVFGRDPAGVGSSPGLGRAIALLLSTEVAQTADPPPESRHLAALEKSRLRAPALWARLERLSDNERRGLVLKDAEFHDAALCELLCDKSVEAAGGSAARASELAGLAVLVAERVPGGEAWRSRTAGYAQMHRGNAIRVRGELRHADQAVARAGAQWRAGAVDDPGLLNEARVLEIEASLRAAQRRMPEALALLDRALVIDRWGETPSLLIGKAKALEETGEYEQALALLGQASAHLEGTGDLRRLFFVRKNTAVVLCHLGRHAEADRRLPEIRSMAAGLGQELELLRLSWLEGRVAAGLGRREEALAAFERVRGRFAELEIAYDAALVTLELAEMHAALGRTAEVKDLARESLPIFRAEGVHREARVALELFRQAAEREAVTVDFLRRLIVYLYRARQNPALRFEARA